MTSKTSLFNKGLLKINLKRWWWFSALYTLFLFLLLPFHHLMQSTPVKDEWVKEMLLRSLNIFSGTSFQGILICTVPIILAVLLFKYLHSDKATAMIHSLPLKRETLFCSHCAVGLLILTLPIILTGSILILLNLSTELKDCYSILNILQWMGLTWLFNTLFFFITVFIGMFTGSAISHLAFTYILNFLPAGLYLLLDYNLRHLLYGYASTNTIEYMFKYLPLFAFINNGVTMDFFTPGNVIIYLLVIAFFGTVALYVYKKRPLETAGDVVTFLSIRPIFKYGVTACAMLLGGAYFGSIYNSQFSLIIFGYILGSLLGYWVAEMLMQKTIKVWRAYKGYLGFLLAAVLLLVGLTSDLTGYIHRIPPPEDVEKVYFGSNFYEWIHLEKHNDADVLNIKYENAPFFQDETNIKSITLLHNNLLQKPYTKEGRNYYIIYTLKNGKHLVRQYNIDEKKTSILLRPIYESVEYKQTRFPLLRQEASDITYIEIRDVRTPKRPLILSNSTEIEEFSTLLKNEMLNSDYSDLTDNRNHGYVNVTIKHTNEMTTEFTKERAEGYNLSPNYLSVYKWLKDKNYYDKIMLLPEEVESVQLEKFNTRAKAPTVQTPPQRIEITDLNIIKELMSLTTPYYYYYEKENNEIVSVYFNITGPQGTFSFSAYLDKNLPLSQALSEYIKQID